MWQISLSGTGGQGLILAGIILAEAAIIDGKEAVLFLVDIKNQLENPSRMLLSL